MAVKAGDRATFRGEACIVMGRAPHLSGSRWLVQWRDGSTITGWASGIAPEASLGSVTTPTFTMGQIVKVGFSPYRQRGTISAITTDENGAIRYTVTLPQDRHTFKTEGGTRWINPAHEVVVGPEQLDTHA